ncbi:MAG: GNAT family N-acetyltransferase [Methanobacteriota archaeon]
MKIEIRKLDKGELAGKMDDFAYTSDGTYRLSLKRTSDGWEIALRKEPFPETFVKDLNEPLLKPYKGETEVYAAFAGGTEAGLIQIEHQAWNNSIRVWDISVDESRRRMGVGTELLDVAKKRARELGARRIVLETQTSNLKAIDFYLANGFELVGFDATSYSNEDVERGEVRLEMAWRPDSLKP